MEKIKLGGITEFVPSNRKKIPLGKTFRKALFFPKRRKDWPKERLMIIDTISPIYLKALMSMSQF